MQRITLLLALFVSTSMCAQTIDEVSNQKIKEYTTDPRFLPASVLNLVDDPKVPTPRKHFGDNIGAPGVMHRTAGRYKYYQALAAVSLYLRVQQVGTSEVGRSINVVIIGNGEAIAKMDLGKKSEPSFRIIRRPNLSGVQQEIFES
jgi:hypothetical protein